MPHTRCSVHQLYKKDSLRNPPEKGLVVGGRWRRERNGTPARTAHVQCARSTAVVHVSRTRAVARCVRDADACVYAVVHVVLSARVLYLRVFSDSGFVVPHNTKNTTPGSWIWSSMVSTRCFDAALQIHRSSPFLTVRTHKLGMVFSRLCLATVT